MAESSPPVGPPRLICRCIGVSSERVVVAALAGHQTEIAEVGLATGAGTGCGTCHPELDEILRAYRNEAVPEAVRLENARVCAQDSFRRVEAAVDLHLGRALPPGNTLELIAVDGLRVELHLGPTRDATLRESLARKLCKLICAELDVRFV
jgi:bacterioferritin-associated ferredoxin